MDIGRAVQFWLNDPQWTKKVLIGGLISIIPLIGGLVVYGYIIRTIRQILEVGDTPLPEWDQFGDDFVRGLKFVVIVVVWMLPLIALSVCIGLLGALSDSAVTAASALFTCFIFLYVLAFLLAAPVIVLRYARRESISDGFQISEIINDVQRNPTQLLIFAVLAYVIGFVAGFGVILCFIGVLFTGFIGNLITAHLVAQISGTLGYERPAAPPTGVY